MGSSSSATVRIFVFSKQGSNRINGKERLSSSLATTMLNYCKCDRSTNIITYIGHFYSKTNIVRHISGEIVRGRRCHICKTSFQLKEEHSMFYIILTQCQVTMGRW